MHALRIPDHLLQLLPGPSLSEVPDQRAREVVSGTPARTAPGYLLSSGLQRAPCAGHTDLAEQEDLVQTLIRGQRGNATGSRRRSKAPRRRGRVSQRAAYLGPD